MKDEGLPSTWQLPEHSRPNPLDSTFDVTGGQATLSLPEPVGEVGRYRLLAVLGEGGMGRVYEAHDPQLNRIVAVKVLRPDRQASDHALSRLATEARITSQLQHPGIVPVHDVGRTDQGQLYYVMKKVEGVSLAQVLAVRRRQGEQPGWSLRRMLTAFARIAQAVGYAHRRGVLHRDLKPGNVMLGPFGEVLVLDWGLARLVHAGDPTESLPESSQPGDHQTRVGSALGTPGYMSPEQARGENERVDARSDVWALGAVLFELISGSRAVVGDSASDLLSAAGLNGIQPLRATFDGQRIAPELREICESCLAAEPDDRPADGLALAERIESFLEGTRQREEARRALDEATELRRQHDVLVRELDRAETAQTVLGGRVPGWAPLDSPEKRALMAAQDRAERLSRERAQAFGRAVGLAEAALARDPNLEEARTFLADLYADRLRGAEARGDVEDAAYLQERVREFGGAFYAALLEGRGAVDLQTDPPGAAVSAARVEVGGAVWGLGPWVPLGSTPLQGERLDMGSYLLRLELPDRPAVLYPIQLGRGDVWPGAAEPVPLPEAWPEGFVYVPGGLFLQGSDEGTDSKLPSARLRLPGFFMARFPVTAEEYLAFLNDLHREDPEAAWLRSPRATSDPTGQSPRLWPRPDAGGRYALPADDEWDPRWPVFGIDHGDASAYAAWLGARLGRPAVLPPEAWWEKAARGVDGRAFPWGSRFDPSLCKMIRSRSDRPQPEPVDAFATDCSPYGVRAVSGGIREWCGDPDFDGDLRLAPVRGGAWSTHERACRVAHRFGFARGSVQTYLGFRVALPLDASTDSIDGGGVG